MYVTFKESVTDDELANVSLFFLENMHDMHPAFTTMDMVSVLYTYMTQGHLHHGELPDKKIVLAGAYFHGTPECDFADKHVAFIESVIVDKAYRGTRVFVQSLKYIVDWISDTHPEVEEIRLMTLSKNTRLCNMYAKFASFSHSRQGPSGEEAIFCEKITRIRSILVKYNRI